MSAKMKEDSLHFRLPAVANKLNRQLHQVLLYSYESAMTLNKADACKPSADCIPLSNF